MTTCATREARPTERARGGPKPRADPARRSSGDAYEAVDGDGDHQAVRTLPKSKERRAAASGEVGRLTRSRAQKMIVHTELGPGAKMTKRRQAAAEGKQEQKPQLNTAAATPGDKSSVSAFAARPLPRRWPAYPKSGKMKDMMKWDLERRMIAKIPDPRLNLPTLREPNDPYTADAVASTEHKKVVRKAALSVVSISTTEPDGMEILQCTGIVVGWDDAKKRARILTYSKAVCHNGRLRDPKPKLSVCLPDRAISEGQLLFFNVNYNIALLEISVGSSLQLPSFGSIPKYGQEVFALARDEDSSLMARHGTILWSEQSNYLGRNYYLVLSCNAPEGGAGGPVIDHDGSVIGMTAFQGSTGSQVLAISTILTCIQMWTKFSRIARPVIGMRLKTLQLLDISLQEEIFLKYKLNDGFIVDKVSVESERLGIRSGDVIVSSFNGDCVSTLPQLEDFLLSLGWGFLQGSTVEWKIVVHDLLGGVSADITLPVGFSDASEVYS